MDSQLEKLTNDIESLKTQKRLLINQINKLQTDFNDKKKLEEEKFDKLVSQMKERILKEEKKFMRRNKKQTKHMIIQTDEIIPEVVQTTEISTMTDPVLELDFEDDVNSQSIEHVVERNLHFEVIEEKPLMVDMCIQCDLMPVQQLSRSFVIEREPEIDIFEDETKHEECLTTVSEYMKKNYKHNYHILKQILKLNEIVHFREEGVFSINPKTLYAINFQFELIQFTNVLKCPLNIIFMGKTKPLFTITYEIFNKKINNFRYTNLSTNETTNFYYDVAYNSKYVILLQKSLNEYRASINKQKSISFPIPDEDVVAIFSNVSSNIWIK